jgi:hypothetical protein
MRDGDLVCPGVFSRSLKARSPKSIPKSISMPAVSGPNPMSTSMSAPNGCSEGSLLMCEKKSSPSPPLPIILESKDSLGLLGVGASRPTSTLPSTTLIGPSPKSRPRSSSPKSCEPMPSDGPRSKPYPGSSRSNWKSSAV